MFPKSETNAVTGRNENMPIAKLTGKGNYNTWVTAANMLLRQEKVARALDPDEMVPDPRKLTQPQQDAAIAEWLGSKFEGPEGGFTAQKIDSNRGKWLKQARGLYNAWLEVDQLALAFIYNSCAPQVQIRIKDETTALNAWLALEKAYSQTGFSVVHTQVDRWKDLTLESCGSLLWYVNRFKDSRSTLESLDQHMSEDLWVALFISGLGENTTAIVREYMSSSVDQPTLQDAIDIVLDMRFVPMAEK